MSPLISWMILLLSTELVSGICPPFSGSFFVEQQDLYPESADWDPNNCILYLGSLFNCSIVAYSPYNKTSEIIIIPGTSHPGSDNFTEYHLNGIEYNLNTGHILATVSSAQSFVSVIAPGPDNTIVVDYSHANYTGPNHLIVYDPKAKRLIADLNLDVAQEEFRAITGNLTNGFQDVAAVDTTGDSYIVGTFGNSIVKLARDTNVPHLWFSPTNYTREYGFGGIAALGEKLIVSDAVSGGFVTFDARDDDPQPTYVELQGLPANYRPLNADGVYSPKRYNGKVVLWSDDYNGTSVYGSDDNWASAHFIGLIANDDPGRIQGAMTTACFEINDRVYVLNQIFQFSLPVKPRKNFPMYDVTWQLDAMVAESFLANSTGP
ncbi:hypothetical protein LTR84_006546 [Exophiala bonariae]|uniref:SMP-30/Gluconolactonase/LRE-like region domain-containing protein n=1 Tax=Exophiala bonariae TaxID=1690606 RepID=A0AAV9N2J9_9EURO|nr:hypothetical protein LTR84_006546 [Exophiala bonariae]